MKCLGIAWFPKLIMFLCNYTFKHFTKYQFKLSPIQEINFTLYATNCPAIKAFSFHSFSEMYSISSCSSWHSLFGRHHLVKSRLGVRSLMKSTDADNSKILLLSISATRIHPSGYTARRTVVYIFPAADSLFSPKHFVTHPSAPTRHTRWSGSVDSSLADNDLTAGHLCRLPWMDYIFL